MGTSEKVISQQAHIKVLREALEFLNARIVTMDLGGVVEKALAIQSSTDALREHDEQVKAEFIERSGKWLVNDAILREHDAKLVEKIADRNLTAGTRIFLAEIADKIRKGEWK